VVALLILFGLPFTRYHLAGLALKKNYTVQVYDSETHSPVSGASVSVGSLNATTNGAGFALFKHLSVGSHTAIATKKYYKDGQAKILVPILKQKSGGAIFLAATGRQVKVTVTNSINGEKLNGVTINVSDINGKTDASGEATLVVPADTTSAKAIFSADGYNDKTVTLTVSDKEVKNNDVKLTPAGKIYFLSKLSGKIDVVKTNLDGTGRQTVLAGTGKEEDTGTVLLASRDWKYLALLSRRDTSTAQLYLIDTSNDKMKPMDSGDAVFDPVGWSDDNFIYSVTRNNFQSWQPKAQALKSYNAPSDQLLTLDQTNASGASDSDFAKEQYGSIYQIGKKVIYQKEWFAPYYNQAVLNDRQAGIYSIDATGKNAQTLKTFGYAVGQSTQISSIPYEANEIYYRVSEKSTDAYYAYEDGKVTAKTDIADDFNSYFSNATTYLLSPSSNQTFWAESRDGKNTLFIGDDGGKNGKQIATLSEYTTYGWFTDDYLLVSKNSSELYIMPKSGPGDNNQVTKISDYHKPARSFLGYGGGYGGL
jgi:hypothetical protein